MDATITASRAEVLRHRYRSRLPECLQELAGPVEGSLDLPLHKAWALEWAEDLGARIHDENA
ncbi:hypothetical protein ACFUN7_18460 [Streptomyces sp. NPDC057236]|uniref:hypothetical protein n=1 Tax=Streptomyces sp. NPDC057236 TaxID=3346059 RepID=UPI00362502E8